MLLFHLLVLFWSYSEVTKIKPVVVSNSENVREQENKLLQRKLMRIVASDFFCWMPISIMAFLQLGGVSYTSYE